MQSLTRGQKVQSEGNSFFQFREEKENDKILFASFEKRNKNLTKYSNILRSERERGISFSSFKKRRERENNCTKFYAQKPYERQTGFEKYRDVGPSSFPLKFSQ